MPSDSLPKWANDALHDLKMAVFGNETTDAPGLKTRVDRLEQFVRSSRWYLRTLLIGVVTLIGGVAMLVIERIFSN